MRHIELIVTAPVGRCYQCLVIIASKYVGHAVRFEQFHPYGGKSRLCPRVIQRIEVYILEGITVQCQVCEQKFELIARLTRRTVERRWTRAHVEVSVSNHGVQPVKKLILPFMQLILQCDRSLPARRHVGDTQLHHGDIGIRRFGRGPGGCLCTGIAVCGRIRVCRIRDRVVESRECRSVNPVVIHTELRCRCCLCHTAALITVLLSRLRDRDIDFPIIGRIRVIAGQENLRVKDVRIVIEVPARHTA